MQRLHLGAAALGTALCLLASSTTHAFTYSTAYMTTWSGCEDDCDGAASLSYTDDVILMFESEMNAAGHSRTHRYVNSNVWASDYTEDNLGGDDDLYSDDSDVHAYSGHGKATDTAYGQIFIMPTCKSGATSSCIWNAEYSRFGERSGEHASAAPGDLRFLILATCYSVDTAPWAQWKQTMAYGTDIIMGYRGLSADSEYTDEVLADLATNAFSGSWTFKSAWFHAVEDWWVNDTGGIVSSGTSDAHASSRLNNLDRTWSRRPAGETHTYNAYAYHDG